MKEFRTKEMSIKIRCACVSHEYFSKHFSDYYDLFAIDYVRFKVHGSYFKFFYKLKSSDSSVFSDIYDYSYFQFPPYVCKSTIY